MKGPKKQLNTSMTREDFDSKDDRDSFIKQVEMLNEIKVSSAQQRFRAKKNFAQNQLSKANLIRKRHVRTKILNPGGGKVASSKVFNTNRDLEKTMRELSTDDFMKEFD